MVVENKKQSNNEDTSTHKEGSLNIPCWVHIVPSCPVPSISGPFWSGVWSSCGSPSWWEEATSWRTLPIHWWPVIRGTSGCWSAYGKSKCLLLGRWIDISVIIYFVWELNKFFSEWFPSQRNKMRVCHMSGSITMFQLRLTKLLSGCENTQAWHGSVLGFGAIVNTFRAWTLGHWPSMRGTRHHEQQHAIKIGTVKRSLKETGCSNSPSTLVCSWV